MDLSRLANPSLIVLAAAYGLLLTVAAAAGLFGLLLFLIVISSVWCYSYQVLKKVAQGRGTIPPPDVEVLSPFGDYRFLLHFGFFAGLAVLLVDPRILGDSPPITLLRWSAVALLGTAFPASAALMALTADLAAALNPKSIVSLIRIWGRRYASILAFGGGLVALSQWLQTIPLPPVLGGLVFRSIDVWTLLAVFCVIGSELRERRELLDIPGELESQEERRQRQLHEEWQKSMDLAYASIRSGLLAEGYRTVRQLVEQAGDSIEVHEWVLDKMLRWEDNAHALTFAGRFIERLLEDGHQYRALQLVSQCRRMSADFSIGKETAASMAAYARSIGHHGMADDLSETSRE